MHLFRTSIVRAALLGPLGLSLFALAFAPACNKGDLGAPCNHGNILPPQSALLVTFPITDCNENLCLFATSSIPPNETCDSDNDCKLPNAMEQPFACRNSKCVANTEFALKNSMCSRHCNSDGDCADDTFKKVVYKDTACASGKFKCQYMQKTGTLCCTTLCVCSDQFNQQLHTDLDRDCHMDAEVQEQCANI